MTKRCIDCGIIFTTDEPERERCDLCEDDRKAEEDADSEYDRVAHVIRRHKRRRLNCTSRFKKWLYGILVKILERIHKNLALNEREDVVVVIEQHITVKTANPITFADYDKYLNGRPLLVAVDLEEELEELLTFEYGAFGITFHSYSAKIESSENYD